MQTLWQDLRYAARAMAKRPGFAAIVILTLAFNCHSQQEVYGRRALLIKTPKAIRARNRP
jgi:hypothetical protein